MADNPQFPREEGAPKNSPAPILVGRGEGFRRHHVVRALSTGFGAQTITRAPMMFSVHLNRAGRKGPNFVSDAHDGSSKLALTVKRAEIAGALPCCPARPQGYRRRVIPYHRKSKIKWIALEGDLKYGILGAYGWRARKDRNSIQRPTFWRATGGLLNFESGRLLFEPPRSIRGNPSRNPSSAPSLAS